MIVATNQPNQPTNEPNQPNPTFTMVSPPNQPLLGSPPVSPLKGFPGSSANGRQLGKSNSQAWREGGPLLGPVCCWRPGLGPGNASFPIYIYIYMCVYIYGRKEWMYDLFC